MANLLLIRVGVKFQHVFGNFMSVDYIKNKIKKESTIFTKANVDIKNIRMYVSHVCGKVCCCIYPAVFIWDHFSPGHDEDFILYHWQFVLLSTESTMSDLLFLACSQSQYNVNLNWQLSTVTETKADRWLLKQWNLCFYNKFIRGKKL